MFNFPQQSHSPAAKSLQKVSKSDPSLPKAVTSTDLPSPANISPGLNGPTKIDRKRCSHRINPTCEDQLPVKRKRGRPPKNPVENHHIQTYTEPEVPDEDSIIQSQSDEAPGEGQHNLMDHCSGKGLKPILNHFLGKDVAENQHQQIVTRSRVQCRKDSLDENPEDSLKFRSQEKESGLSSLDRSQSADSHKKRRVKDAQERNSLDADPDFEPKKFHSKKQRVNSEDEDYQQRSQIQGSAPKVAQTSQARQLEYFDPSSPQLHITYGEESKLQPGMAMLAARCLPNYQHCVKQEAFEEQHQMRQAPSDDPFHSDLQQPKREQKKDYELHNQVLIEMLPLLGRVPLVFYVPTGTDQDHIDLILANGGQVTNIVECFTYQLSLVPAKSSSTGGRFEDSFSKKQPNPKLYYPGNIYSFEWVLDCIKSGQVQPVDRYLVMTIPYPQSQTQTNHGLKKQSGLSGQRTRFTMRELIKIFMVTEQFPSKKNKNQVYWQRFIKQGYFPGRSVNSVNAQWQRFCHYETVETALEKALQLGMPYSTAFNTLPSSVDCQILTMKSESMLAGKLTATTTAAPGGVKVKQEGQTLIKNFQSHNVHFQHFMKQKSGGPQTVQCKKESGQRHGVKQESTAANSYTVAGGGSRPRPTDLLNDQLQKELPPLKKDKKHFSKFKQEASPSSQPSVNHGTQPLKQSRNLESRRVSADSMSMRQAEIPLLPQHYGGPPAATNSVIDVEQSRFNHQNQMPPRESSDDIIKVKQEVRDENEEDEANQLSQNATIPNTTKPPKTEQVVAKGNTAKVTLSKKTTQNQDSVKNGGPSKQKTDLNQNQAQQVPQQQQKVDQSVLGLVPKVPAGGEEEKRVGEKKDQGQQGCVEKAGHQHAKALSQKRMQKQQSKADAKNKKMLAAAAVKEKTPPEQPPQQQQMQASDSVPKDQQQVKTPNSILNELPKECIYCLAKRLYIGTNAKLKSKESISSRFFRLNSDSDKFQRSKSLTVSFSKDNPLRRIYLEDADSIMDHHQQHESNDPPSSKPSKDVSKLKVAPQNPHKDPNLQSGRAQEPQKQDCSASQKPSRHTKSNQAVFEGGPEEQDDGSRYKGDQVSPIHFWNGHDFSQQKQRPDPQQPITSRRPPVNNGNLTSFREYNFEQVHQYAAGQQLGGEQQQQPYQRTAGYNKAGKQERPSSQSLEKQQQFNNGGGGVQGSSIYPSYNNHVHQQNNYGLGADFGNQYPPPHSHLQQAASYQQSQQNNSHQQHNVHASYGGHVHMQYGAPSGGAKVSHQHRNYLNRMEYEVSPENLPGRGQQQLQQNRSAQSIGDGLKGSGQNYDPLDGGFMQAQPPMFAGAAPPMLETPFEQKAFQMSGQLGDQMQPPGGSHPFIDFNSGNNLGGLSPDLRHQHMLSQSDPDNFFRP